MHGAHNTDWNAHHTLCSKCIYARACAHMQRCRSFFAMEAIVNLFWVLHEHRSGCRLPPALAAPPAVSTKPVARRCWLIKSVQIHASSWRSRCCGVAQASFDHLRWCRPHPVCLWVAFVLGHGAHPSQKSIFAIFRAIFFQKEVWWRSSFLVHQNSLAFCERYRHSVESRALTGPFKQSNLSAWSLSWRSTFEVDSDYPSRLLPTVTVKLSDSNYVNKSASLKRSSWIICTINEFVDRIKNFRSNASQNDQKEDFLRKTCAAGQMFCEQQAPQARFLIKQNATQAEFLDSVLMGTLSCRYSM